MKIKETITFLYHGSDVSGIKLLKPRYSRLTDSDVVFAATYPEVAIAMTGHWTDDDFEFGRIQDSNHPNDPYVMKELILGSFEKFFSKPVFLYFVSSEGFHSDKNIQDFERINEKPVPILRELVIKNPLDFLQRSLMVKMIYG